MRFFHRILLLLGLALLPLSAIAGPAEQRQVKKKVVRKAVQPTFEELSMPDIDTLNAAIVEADKQKRTAVTQTSLTRISPEVLSRGYATFGTPDLIRILQQLPGVASGTELMSGLYVRGGDGSDNLFLIDGVPMYQVTHLIGLFSSFNTDVVQNVDFYKGGFPARYGGRLSSVVDVSVNEGGFDSWHGSASLGLVDGRIQVDGPLVKGRTSLNFGMRRTWTDIVKGIAMLFITNPLDEEMAASSHYDFGDFNLKLTHKFSENSKLSFSAYYGQDFGNAMMKVLTEEDPETQSKSDASMDFDLRWGNTLGTLKWEKKWTETLLMDAQLYHTRYASNMGFLTDMYEETVNEQGGKESVSIKLDEYNRSRVFDTGASVNFYSKRFSAHSLRFGGDFVAHTYDPDRSSSTDILYNGLSLLKEEDAQSKTYGGGELGLYFEDEISFSERAKLNLGLRNSLFFVAGKVYERLEPRVAARVFLSDNLSLKGSWSTMNQFSHQVAATYLDLPTNLWMPSTALIKPMHSDQGVLGFIYKFSRGLSLDVECFYKRMTNMYEYTGVNTMLPQIDRWEDVFSEGKGRAYGAELSIEYRTHNLQLGANYTLSKSERFFENSYYTWYPDRNDNRHRINLTGSYRFNRRFELYAGWIFHSGNRFTGKSAYVWDQENGVQYEIYGSPNNYTLPPYHRLDLGFNWHHKTRKGGERTFNISVYNAYCHINPMFGMIEERDGKMVGIAYGLIPIVPSISYLWKF